MNLKENSMNKIKEWFKKVADIHIDITDEIKWKFNLSSYQIMWFAYFEGIMTTLIVIWVLL